MALRNAVKAFSDKLLLGRCLPCVHNKVIKVEVPILELDEYILMYFTQKVVLHAYDPGNTCKTGDLVLIKKLSEIKKMGITHELVEVAYRLGDVTDPVTGEKCAGTLPRSFLEREANLYGKLNTAFDFAKAPPRGVQEGKRDFSDKITYVKYHQFMEDEEESKDPYAL